MRTRSSRSFFANLAVLLFGACLMIYAVVCTVYCSFHLSFAETAARTELVLSLLSCLLVVAISIFATYAMRRDRKHRVK